MQDGFMVAIAMGVGISGVEARLAHVVLQRLPTDAGG